MKSSIVAAMLLFAFPAASVSSVWPEAAVSAIDSTVTRSTSRSLAVAPNVERADTTAPRPRGPHRTRPAWHYIPLTLLAAGALYLGFVFYGAAFVA